MKLIDQELKHQKEILQAIGKPKSIYWSNKTKLSEETTKSLEEDYNNQQK